MQSSFIVRAKVLKGESQINPASLLGKSEICIYANPFLIIGLVTLAETCATLEIKLFEIFDG